MGGNFLLCLCAAVIHRSRGTVHALFLLVHSNVAYYYNHFHSDHSHINCV